MKSCAGVPFRSDGINESHEVKRMKNFPPLELWFSFHQNFLNSLTLNKERGKIHLDGPLRRQIECMN